jgi:putative component of membrane protein insertase Oxa1/YidC/SpoIIIJ protein YidD
MTVASSMGVALIEGYQRWLSPRKGFRCAYGALHGDGTCSSIGKRIMRERGFFAFFRLMPEQFAACKLAAASLNNETEEERKRRRKPKRGWLHRRVRDDGNDSSCDPDMDCSDIDCSGCDMDIDFCSSSD